MTVILASLAMDLAWTPPSQENERIPPVLFAVCFFHSLVPTMRYWEEKKKNGGCWGAGKDVNIHCLHYRVERCLTHHERQ